MTKQQDHPIYYRHYDMKDRVEQSPAHGWFNTVTPMTTMIPIATCVVDDFGVLQPIDFLNLAASLANSEHGL